MLTPSRFAALIVSAALLAGASSALTKATPEQKCQAGKNRAAGKYTACRQNAEATLATSGDIAKYYKMLAKCEAKFTSAWQKLEAKATKAGASCLDDALTVDSFESLIQSCTETVADGLRSGALPSVTTTTSLPPFLATNQTTCYDLLSNTPKA